MKNPDKESRIQPMKYEVEILGESCLAMAQSLIQKALDSAGISDIESVALALGYTREQGRRWMADGERLTFPLFGKILAVCEAEPRFSLLPGDAKNVETLAEWEGQETGTRFKITRNTKLRVEFFHPEVGGWAKASDESERDILAKRGFTFE